MLATLAQTIVCRCANPPVTTGKAVVDGLIAFASCLGLGSCAGGGSAALALAFTSRVDPDERADMINRGMGAGFAFGVALGVVAFVAYASKVITA